MYVCVVRACVRQNMSQCPHAIEPLHERIALERALFADVLALDGERHLKLFARAQLGLHNEQITVRAFGAMIERLTKWRVCGDPCDVTSLFSADSKELTSSSNCLPN